MSTLPERDETAGRFARSLSNVRERWWAVLFTMVVVGGLVLGVSLLLEPRYKATAQVAYSARDAQIASNALTDSGTAELVHNISSDALTLTTSAFAGRVSQAMGGRIAPDDLRSSIEVASDPVGDAISVTAVSSDPLKAVEIADAYAAGFVAERQEKIQESLAEAQTLLEARMETLTPEEAESERGAALQQQIDDLAVFSAMQITDYEILQGAIAPTSAYFPKPLFNLLLGLCAGLVLGLLLALLLGFLDRRIKDRFTLENVLDLPVLGTMPGGARKKGMRASAANPAVGFRQGNEALLEPMRMLRSNLKVLGFGETKRSVLVTSAAPGEGKSTLAVNLALTMALAGDRVILVDADLRNPAIHRYLGIPNTEGLGDVLLEEATSWSDKIQAVDLGPFIGPQVSLARKSTDGETPVSKFLCLTSGSLPGNPSEILESPAMADLLAELQGISDYVILDAPPMLTASDPLILAQSVDAIILASTLGRETAAEAAQVRQLLARAEVTALGIVLYGEKAQPREGHRRPGYENGMTARRG